MNPCWLEKLPQTNAIYHFPQLDRIVAVVFQQYLHDSLTWAFELQFWKICFTTLNKALHLPTAVFLPVKWSHKTLWSWRPFPCQTLYAFLSRPDSLETRSLNFFGRQFLLLQNPLSKATSQLPEPACFQITIMLSLAFKVQIKSCSVSSREPDVIEKK